MATQTTVLLIAGSLAFLLPFAGYGLHLHLESKRRRAQKQAQDADASR